MNSKSAVVTVGAGFIDSHLVDGLLERGYGVTIIDDLSTGKLRTPPTSSTQQTLRTQATQETQPAEGRGEGVSL